ncbi:holo-ACP synthase [Natronospora cellulosivora (SeqCode)]
MLSSGIDLVNLSRFHSILKSNKRFKSRVYTCSERYYCDQYKFYWRYYAQIFAGKEAVVKALGTGINGFAWQDVEIAYFDGVFKVNLYNIAREIIRSKNIEEIKISLSHDKNYAIAFAVAL